MSPHISRAVALLAEKARRHRARLDGARRTYVRTLVLDEPADPQLLADAVETLGLTPADFLKDAQSGQLHRDSLALIAKLEIQIRDRRNRFPPPEPTDSDDDSYTPDDELRELVDQFEIAQRHLVEAPRRSPRLFSAEAQKLVELPDDPSPPPAAEIPVPKPSPANAYAY